MTQAQRQLIVDRARNIKAGDLAREMVRKYQTELTQLENLPEHALTPKIRLRIAYLQSIRKALLH